jgi:hypothetical protein
MRTAQYRNQTASIKTLDFPVIWGLSKGASTPWQQTLPRVHVRFMFSQSALHVLARKGRRATRLGGFQFGSR